MRAFFKSIFPYFYLIFNSLTVFKIFMSLFEHYSLLFFFRIHYQFKNIHWGYQSYFLWKCLHFPASTLFFLGSIFILKAFLMCIREQIGHTELYLFFNGNSARPIIICPCSLNFKGNWRVHSWLDECKESTWLFIFFLPDSPVLQLPSDFLYCFHFSLVPFLFPL